MLDYETFLTQLYVMIDDFCKQELLPVVKSGPAASLSRSEVMTIAIVGQWHWFSSERDFYRFAARNWRHMFPNLPNRAQLNRLMRQQTDAITAFMLHLAERMGRSSVPYEAFDSSGVATRNTKRRGNGWLPGLAMYGKCTRLGFYEGFHLLISVTPTGVIAGYGFGSGNTHDAKLAERAHIEVGGGDWLAAFSPTGE